MACKWASFVCSGQAVREVPSLAAPPDPVAAEDIKFVRKKWRSSIPLPGLTDISDPISQDAQLEPLVVEFDDEPIIVAVVGEPGLLVKAEPESSNPGEEPHLNFMFGLVSFISG